MKKKQINQSPLKPKPNKITFGEVYAESGKGGCRDSEKDNIKQ